MNLWPLQGVGVLEKEVRTAPFFDRRDGQQSQPAGARPGHGAGYGTRWKA